MLRTLEARSQAQEQTSLLSSDAPIFLTGSANQTAIGLNELQQCSQLIQGIANCQETLQEKILKMIENVQERQYNKGLGYFNAKNLVFLEYLIQLQFYELFRINVADLTKGVGLDLYRRLVYLKTLLTKLSPIQKKLEYQKNKLLKISDLINVKSDQPQKNQNEDDNQEVQDQENDDFNEGEEDQIEENNAEQSQSDDVLAYQPRPQSLMTVKQKKEAQLAKQGKYVAPKISATLSKQDKIRRRQEQQEERRKAFLIRKYRDDLIDDDQAREQGVEDELAQKIKKKFREKTTIEEDNFVRLPQTKKDKFWKKQLIQRFNKTDHLRDTLKQVEMVGQIYRTQIQEQQRSDAIYNQRRQKAAKPTKIGKTGTKKQKRQ